MTVPGRAPQTYRFGLFEVDERRGDVLKQGFRLRLRGRPYDILLILLERPGELITRDELRNRLWSSDTFVDFDHGLNASVNRLREVIGDSAESPRFIETVPRKGYRFIAPVTVAPSLLPRPVEDRAAVAAHTAVPAATPLPLPVLPSTVDGEAGTRWFRRPWPALGIGLLVVAVLAGVWRFSAARASDAG